MMRSLALLACVLGSAALDACINPCPRRQLMTYVAHTQGGLTKGVDVAARVDADDDWRVVGKVTAADATKLSRAAALQHRLIEEHARRLHKGLRTGPGGPPLELGIGDPITAVPTPPKRDFVAASVMTQAGFAGTPKNEKGSDVYANFVAPYDAPYDRGAVRAEIDAIIRRAPLVLFGWSTCWFCTDAERLLKDANLPYRSVYMDLWKPGGPYHDHAVGDDGSLAAKRAKNIRKATNPLQAELSLLAGRCTVPVVVVRGKVLDGDEQHGSVVEAIASGELARAVSDSSPWAPAWPSSPPPPLKVMKRCRVCRGRYSDDENHAAACRHHPGALRGESARKGDWEATPSDDDLVWTYSCCGGAADAPGCVVDLHRSYDDD